MKNKLLDAKLRHTAASVENRGYHRSRRDNCALYFQTVMASSGSLNVFT